MTVKTKQCRRCLTPHLDRIYNGYAQKCLTFAIIQPKNRSGENKDNFRRDVVYTFIKITYLTANIKILLIFMRLQLAVPIDYHS